MDASTQDEEQLCRESGPRIKPMIEDQQPGIIHQLSGLNYLHQPYTALKCFAKGKLSTLAYLKVGMPVPGLCNY